MILSKTSMDKMPENCLDCENAHCRLGEKQHSDTIQKKYQTKRHENCPLVNDLDKDSLIEYLNSKVFCKYYPMNIIDDVIEAIKNY